MRKHTLRSFLLLPILPLVFVLLHAHLPLPFLRFQSAARETLPTFPYEIHETPITETLLTPYLHHHSNTLYPNQKYLIARPDNSPTHGLGDRLRGTITAFFLSILTNRTFLLQWANPFPLEQLFHLGHPPNNFSYSRHHPTDGPVISGNYLYSVHRSNDTNNKVLFLDSVPRPNTTLWFSAPPRLLRRHPLLRNLSAVRPLPSEEEVIAPMLRALLVPTQDLRVYIQTRLKELDFDPGTPYVSIHARLGYGLDEIRKAGKRFNLTTKGLDMPSMARCIASRAVSLSGRLDTPPVFFLATDTPSFRELFMGAVDMATGGNGSVVTGNWAAKHIRDVAGMDREQGYRNAFLDIYILSRGRGMAYIKSGFADVARWMGVLRETDRVEYEQCVGY